MPVFAIFFPVEIAIALTGVVHFSNKLFKMSLVGKRADKEVLLKFGVLMEEIHSKYPNTSTF